MAENSFTTVSNDTSRANESSISLRDVFYLIANNWYWFLISLLIAFSIGVLYILKTPPQYSQEMQMLIKEDNNKSLSSEFSKYSSVGIGNPNENMQNVLMILKSPSYVQDVVRNLKLDVGYSTDGTFHDLIAYGTTLPITVTFVDVADSGTASLDVELLDGNQVKISNFILDLEEKESKSLVAKMGAVVSSPVGRILISPTKYYMGKSSDVIHVKKYPFDKIVRSFSTRINSELVHEWSTVVSVKITDTSIERAEDILKELFNVYNKRWLEEINDNAVNTAKFIDDELRIIEGELGSVDADISSFKSQNLVPNVETASNIYMNKAEAMSTQLLELSNQLYMARYIRKQLNDDGANFSVLPGNSGIDNPTVSRLITSYNELVLQRNTLAANSNASNPLVKDLDDQLNATKRAIAGSLDNVIASVSSQIANLKGSESRTKGQIAANPNQAKYLLSVERQQKVKEQLYVFLLQKREETQLSKAFSTSNSKLLMPPTGNRKPTAPVKINVMLICLLLGLFLPLIALIIRNSLDSAVYSRKDVERLSLPFIGEIPLSYRKRRGLLGLLTNRRKDVREIVVEEHNGNVINEAFRVVRTNMEFVLGREGRCKTLMFTSANAGSGKTFLSMNLAMSFAIKEKKILVIDLDMRKASLSAFVNSPTMGISNYLSERTDDINCVIVKGKLNPNLDVIPVGTIPPNPTELLFSDRLEQLLAVMKQNYDYIFIDCPPVDIVADSAIINKFVDMTVFVIRSGLFDKSMLPDVERNYTEKRFKNMVTVLNGVYDDGHGYGHYGYGYGYGYGYYHDKKKS